MCHASCVIFGARNLSREEISGKRVLEVGSCNVNGGLRSLLEDWRPRKYVGVDIEKGPGVDVVCNAEDLLEVFGRNSFDVVISTELLEHVKDWKKVISSIKNVCRPGGTILITTRSYGFRYHAYPNDFWRYELDDMKRIFSDCGIVALESDVEAPGVFIKAKKPARFVETELSGHKLYNIVYDKRVSEINASHLGTFYFKQLVFRARIKKILKYNLHLRV